MRWEKCVNRICVKMRRGVSLHIIHDQGVCTSQCSCEDVLGQFTAGAAGQVKPRD